MVFFCSLLKYLLFVVAFVELINTSIRVKELMNARVEMVAMYAKVNKNHVAFFGGTRYEFRSASAFHSNLVVVGM